MLVLIKQVSVVVPLKAYRNLVMRTQSVEELIEIYEQWVKQD